jgi:pimeloyl-ACP methyl ester carboxylesterase
MSVARECRPELVSEIEAEVDGMDESRQEVRDSGTLGEIPLVVISRDPIQSDEQWKQMQRELTQLSSRETQIIAKDSGHFIQVDRPDVVIDAIHRVFDDAEKTVVHRTLFISSFY